MHTRQHSPAPSLQRRTEPAAAAPSLAPYSPGYHYAASPLQRRENRNGISARENAAVHQLSGGQVDLHAMGASLQRVSASDPRLTAVGARSYAQGTQALVSSDGDRGHELWHMAQQAMGQVKADTTIGGQPVNTQDHLEREADSMGNRISSFFGA